MFASKGEQGLENTLPNGQNNSSETSLLPITWDVLHAVARSFQASAPREENVLF